MDIQGDLRWIQRELQNVEDPDIVAMIKNILNYRRKITKEQRISIEQYNKEIDQAIEDVKAGRVHTHEQIKEMIKQWGER